MARLLKALIGPYITHLLSSLIGLAHGILLLCGAGMPRTFAIHDLTPFRLYNKRQGGHDVGRHGHDRLTCDGFTAFCLL
jgi:hypothetical protein